MLNKQIISKKHLLYNEKLIMYIMKAMKNSIIRLSNWLVVLIRRIFSSKEDLFEMHSKYTRDKVSKVVLFL
jgi:hypothetical protein